MKGTAQLYELTGHNTDSRYAQDLCYREYTTSKARAEAFGKIPKIQFSDSGHGIVFRVKEHKGQRKKRIYAVDAHVQKHLHVVEAPGKEPKRKSDIVKHQARIDELTEKLKSIYSISICMMTATSDEQREWRQRIENLSKENKCHN